MEIVGLFKFVRRCLKPASKRPSPARPGGMSVTVQRSLMRAPDHWKGRPDLDSGEQALSPT